MKMSRAWSMPSSETFLIPPISKLLDRRLRGCAVVLDPCCGSSRRGTLRNDLYNGVDAVKWLRSLDVVADAVLFDPPYSPRQTAECYRSIGLTPTKTDTQNARFCRQVKDYLSKLLRPGGIAVCCGWNSNGFGRKRGFALLEILVVAHGAAHNDTIVTVERKKPRLRAARGAGKTR